MPPRLYRYVFHTAKVKPGAYIGRIWKDDIPTRHGLPMGELAEARLPLIEQGGDDGVVAIREAFWLPPQSKIEILLWPGEGDALAIIAYAAFVSFSGGDQQTLEDQGLDPEETTAEQFYQATGEWPQASNTAARLECVAVPGEYKNVIADVRSLQADGWKINQVAGAHIDDAQYMQKQMQRRLRGNVEREEIGVALKQLDQEFAQEIWMPDGPGTPARGTRELY